MVEKIFLLGKKFQQICSIYNVLLDQEFEIRKVIHIVSKTSNFGVESFK